MSFALIPNLLTAAFVLIGYVLFYRLPILKTAFIDLLIKVPVLLGLALLAKYFIGGIYG